MQYIKHYLITFLFLSLINNVFSTDYYVNYSTGNDNNNGLTTSTPFKRCPGDLNATGTALATTLSPGDNVYFRNDVTYFFTTGTGLNARIRILASGSSGNYITYDGESWGTVGSRAIIDGEHRSAARGFTTATNYSGFTELWTRRDFIHIKGFVIQKMGGYADNNPIWSGSTPIPTTTQPSDHGVSFHGNCSDIIIENVNTDRLSIWQNHPNVTVDGNIQGIGFDFENVYNLQIINCGSTRSRKGISLNTRNAAGLSNRVSNVTIDGFTVSTNIVWGIDLRPRSANSTYEDVTIKNYINYNWAQFDSQNWLGSGANPHRDGIFFANSAGNTTWDNIIIEKCKFYEDFPGNGGYSGGGTASLFFSQGGSAIVRNCLFIQDKHGSGSVNIGFTNIGAGQRKVEFYNNTFYSTSFVTYNHLPTNSVADNSLLILSNNIIMLARSDLSTPAYRIIHNSTAKLRSNNNIFFNNSGNLPNWTMAQVGNVSYTFNGWKNLGFDSQSLLIDPQLVSRSGLPSTMDFKLKSTSPAINIGANLIALVTDDYAGVFRPSSGPFEIGAYEFAQTSTDIRVIGNSQQISNGDTTPTAADGTSFGVLQVTNATATRSFTISNPGTVPLNLTASPIVQLSGHTNFTIVSQPSANQVGAGQSLPFSLKYTPTVEGSVSSVVSIGHDGTSTTPFTFTISGTGFVPEPPPPVVSAPATLKNARLEGARIN